MPPKQKLPKYVEKIPSHGKLFYYLRHKGKRIARLPDDPESPEFFEAYAAAMRRLVNDPKPKRAADGTVGWLIACYKATPAFQNLASLTQRSYDRELERLSSISAFPAVDIRRRHIHAIRDRLQSTPRTRQLFGQVCSALFNYGIREHELEMLNPARLLQRDGEAESFVAWTDAQMEAFEASAPPVHLMTAYMVARYTGPRRGDITGLRRSHYDGATLFIAGAKTSNPVAVRVHERLRAYLDSLPATLTLIADAQGRPVAPTRLTHDIRAHLDAIGLQGLHLHGLRHTAGKALAEAGCSPHEIQAVLGHKSLQMVERYTKKAQQEGMASAAVLKLERNGKRT
jgi:hypothetical protein